jgi:hypothetical protein
MVTAEEAKRLVSRIRQGEEIFLEFEGGEEVAKFTGWLTQHSGETGKIFSTVPEQPVKSGYTAFWVHRSRNLRTS